MKSPSDNAADACESSSSPAVSPASPASAASGKSSPRRVSDALVTKGVETEFDRTLPFWRNFTDIQAAYQRRPAVMDRETTIVFRAPCQVFPGVDVVWANTRVTLRVPAAPRALPSGKRYRSEDAECKLRRFWLDVPFQESSWLLGTMHFVHDDAFMKGKGSDHSFHIQSVIFLDNPAILQCVAGTMVSYAFIVYSSLSLLDRRKSLGSSYSPLARNRSEESRCALADAPFKSLDEVLTAEAELQALGELCPSTSSSILVLGMGGNSIAMSLRRVLGPKAQIHVVELEPAVVEACRAAGSWSDKDPNMHVHLADAAVYLDDLGIQNSFDMVFMDIFEPVEASMQSSGVILERSLRCVRPGGLVVINDHRLPTAASLSQFVALVGASNVQAVNLHGWNESVIVCVKPGAPWNDGASVQCTKRVADTVYTIYEKLLPGWLPHSSWLKTSRLEGKVDSRVRIWVS